MDLGRIRNLADEKVFLISNTHGGETHSLAAALATINEFKTKNVIAHNHSIGQHLIDSVNALLAKRGMQDFIAVSPTNWMPAFSFKNKDKAVDNGMRTLFLQEMIKRGVLFQGTFVPCFSHQMSDVDYFVEAFAESLDVY